MLNIITIKYLFHYVEYFYPPIEGDFNRITAVEEVEKLAGCDGFGRV